MPEAIEPKVNEQMEKIVSLCKRRGFIFQSSEIYGGINGFWDYGPLGAELKRNVKDYWWRSLTQRRDDIAGLDASIIMHPRIWEASGHTSTFSDPMVDCLLTRKRFRADQIDPQTGTVYHYSGALDAAAGKQCDEAYAVLIETGKHPEYARKIARQYYQQRGVPAPELQGERTEAVENSTRFNPDNGSLLTDPRPFNLMFKTYVGPVESQDNVAFLRPETAQAIFAQFKNVLEVSRQKVPFGICQIGKAFRNEINPRNFTFRSREFEQMELEFFIKPDEIAQAKDGAPAPDAPVDQPQPNWGWKEWHRHWVEERIRWYESIGLDRDSLDLYWQKNEELAHYAKATVDILYKFPFGTQELEGIAARGDFDLSQHQKFSGKSMDYFDEDAKARYVPHVIEPSAGVDRLVLALICHAFREETVTDEKGKSEVRTVMKFHPRIAPIKVGVFPLLKNRPELVQKAREVRDLLRPHMTVFYDEAGAIGRRYRRQDEAGTPFGVTIDFDTLGEHAELKETVTLRDRDSMKQTRVRIDELVPQLIQKIQ
ncbi:MAG TPA: glycine--tRNA ligase [Candidatus Paceibacterota bacterium]|nr:glycine--tRNA ligase [Verrucomicrobiota bacterium]HRY50344.1 glycine--tRNA ligase [Candidatus Paceibacterota bacterium]HSA01033.1 glycine--tRNA ligase [Candidatus Paceibacterota bacterium]